MPIFATNHDTITPLTMVHHCSQGVVVNIQQPQLVRKYNMFMGGVDLFDQHVATYCIAFQAKKWYWPILMHAIDSAVVNASLIYRSQNLNSSQLDFCRVLVLTYRTRAAANRAVWAHHAPMLPGNVRYDNVGHMVAQRLAQHKCQHAGCSSRPQTYCTKCNAALCITCFIPYHTM